MTAQVVYAKAGTKQDFDALEAAGVDVTGKLVIIDADFTSWWANDQAAEATYRGAIGVIFTYGPGTGTYYNHADDTLGTFDSQFDMTDAPAVYIAKKDGDWLKSQLDANGVGPVTTMRLIEKVRLASEGGRGYNVVGDIPGTRQRRHLRALRRPPRRLLPQRHRRHRRLRTNLAIAKAMMMSGYKPQHTVRFMFVTGEEFGYTNCLQRLVHRRLVGRDPRSSGVDREDPRVHQQRPDAGRRTLHHDGQPRVPALSQRPGHRFRQPVRCPRLAGGDHAQQHLERQLHLHGGRRAGVTVSSGGKVPQSNGVYHTQYMTIDLNDFTGLAQDAKFIGRLAQGLDWRSAALQLQRARHGACRQGRCTLARSPSPVPMPARSPACRTTSWPSRPPLPPSMAAPVPSPPPTIRPQTRHPADPQGAGPRLHGAGRVADGDLPARAGVRRRAAPRSGHRRPAG